MANVGDLMAVLALLKDRGGEDTDTFAAEHDQLFLPGPSPDELDLQATAALNEHGALWDAENESWFMLFT